MKCERTLTSITHWMLCSIILLIVWCFQVNNLWSCTICRHGHSMYCLKINKPGFVVKNRLVLIWPLIESCFYFSKYKPMYQRVSNYDSGRGNARWDPTRMPVVPLPLAPLAVLILWQCIYDGPFFDYENVWLLFSMIFFFSPWFMHGGIFYYYLLVT